MKAWLCLNPLIMSIQTLDGKVLKLDLPEEALAILGVFRTKKAARKVFGRKAILLSVERNRIEDLP